MVLSRLFITAAAASLIACPLGALAQTPTTPSAPTASPTPALAASPHVVPNGNMISTLQGSGHFTILLKALDAANLTATLAKTPDLTLFAPTDDAFRSLPAGQLNGLMMPSNAPILQKVLIYHLVHLNLDSSKIKGAKGPVPTVETSNLVVDGSGPVLKVNDADIIQSDIHATNGFIQVVDKVLVPSDVTLPTASAAATPPATSSGG
jgi:uncharacterized surface protein with fasciclin (FAS1) repeats